MVMLRIERSNTHKPPSQHLAHNKHLLILALGVNIITPHISRLRPYIIKNILQLALSHPTVSSVFHCAPNIT